MSENEKYVDPLHMHPDTYKVEHTRETYYLNKRLLDSKNAWGNLSELVETHKMKLTLFDEMDKTDDSVKLHAFADGVQQLEFKLQRLWGFSENAHFHEWYLVPKCTCPKMDNADYRGTKYGITSGDCPVHG